MRSTIAAALELFFHLWNLCIIAGSEAHLRDMFCISALALSIVGCIT